MLEEAELVDGVLSLEELVDLVDDVSKRKYVLELLMSLLLVELELLELCEEVLRPISVELLELELVLELLLEERLLVDSEDGVEAEDPVLTELGVSLAIVLELDELLELDEELLRARYVELDELELLSELEVDFSRKVELDSED